MPPHGAGALLDSTGTYLSGFPLSPTVWAMEMLYKAVLNGSSQAHLGRMWIFACGSVKATDFLRPVTEAETVMGPWTGQFLSRALISPWKVIIPKYKSAPVSQGSAHSLPPGSSPQHPPPAWFTGPSSSAPATPSPPPVPLPSLSTP